MRHERWAAEQKTATLKRGKGVLLGLLASSDGPAWGGSSAAVADGRRREAPREEEWSEGGPKVGTVTGLKSFKICLPENKDSSGVNSGNRETGNPSGVPTG